MNESRKYPKYSSLDLKKKSVNLPDSTIGFFSSSIAKACICNGYGYIEFHRE